MRKFLFAVLCIFLVQASVAQVTLTTNTTGSVYGSATGGAIVFAVRNTNANPILITSLSSRTENPYTATYTLWYKDVLTGTPGAISAANGWTQIAGPFTVPSTQPTGLTELFPGLNFQIPASTAYRFALLGSGDRSPYYATANSSPNIFSTSGVDIIHQDNPFSPGYGGTTSTPTLTPRGFYGSITFMPVDPCTDPPIAGTVSVIPSLVCEGTPVTLSVSGNSFATGNTYTWESSPTYSGTYTTVATSTTSNSLTIAPPATAYYRLATSCNSGSPVTTVPELVSITPILGGNTYTIDNTLPTGGANFNSFTDAFNALACGINGKVIFNVTAGQMFFENPPELNATGTASDSIIFRKWGTGNNPVIMPTLPGTIASSTTLGAHGDGVIVINGGDYITFDGIDINANGFGSGPDMYEYGYYVKKKSGTDASKHIAIRNSVITLNKAAIQSFGIFISNNSGSTANITIPYTSGATENVYISGNTINNAYGGIMIRGYNDTALYDRNIYIGVDSGNTITDFGGAGTTAYGIYTLYTNSLVIGNNTVTSATSGHTSTIYGIYTGTSTNADVDIYNNTVSLYGEGTTSTLYGIYNTAGGSGTDNKVRIFDNTLTGFTYSTATSGTMYMLYNAASAYDLEMYGNEISNNTHSPSTTGSMYMLYQGGSVVNSSKVYDNHIHSNIKVSGTTGTVMGIYHTSASSSINTVYNNRVHDIAITSTSGSLTGIQVLTADSSVVYNNQIYGLTNTASTTGAVYGITVGSGALKNHVFNNFISDLNAPTSTNSGTTTTDLIRGINITSTTANSTQYISHNSILINASGGTNFSAAGVFHTFSSTATTSTLQMRNNIIVNTSTPSGTGYVSALRRSGASLANYGELSDRNVFYVNNGPNQVIYYDGTNSDIDMTAFKARVSPMELLSVSELPQFVNGIVAPYDLHIDPAYPTQIESGGVPVEGVTTDIDGNPRNATNPDIGADEFNGIAADLTGPIVNYTPFETESICITNKTITAEISDPSGVDVTPGSKPRLWFKKAHESDMLAATNTSASDGWKYVEASNNESPFVFTMDFSLLTSPLIPGDSVSYFIAAQDSASTPNVGASVVTFNSNPPHVELTAVAFPVTGEINGFQILTLPAVQIKAKSYELCVSGEAVLDVDGVNVTGGEYQWQSSPHNANTWTDITGGTTIPFTTPVIADTTDFRLVVMCGGTPVAASPSNVITINVNDPQLSSTTGATRCGTGTVNLMADASGYNVNWYETETSSQPLYTGNTFTTPIISSTTTYYAAAVASAGALTSTAMVTPTPGAISGAGTTNYGIVFDAINDFKLHSVTVYPVHTNAGTPGSVTIDVVDAANNVIQTGTFNVVGYPSSSPVGQTLVLDFLIPAGNGYKIRPGVRSGVSGLLFEPSPSSSHNYGYPYVIPGYVSINHSTLSATNTERLDLYYYFYDWQVETPCVGTRVPVVATVTTPPALTTSGSKTLCNAAVDSIAVTSALGDFDTYIWAPTQGLYIDAAGTIPYNGTSAAKVYVKGGAGVNYYTVTATNTTTSCANAVTDSVSILPVATLSSSINEICKTGDVTLALDPGTGYGNANITWLTSTDGTTYTPVAGADSTAYLATINATTYFRVNVQDSAGTQCLQEDVTVIVNDPDITAFDGMHCGPGSVQLTATSTGDIRWYAAATGGVPIGTGSVFQTPVISNTTTYYASAVSGGGGSATAGLMDAISTSGYTLEAGLFFDAISSFTLVGVHVYPMGTGAGVATIALQDNTGTTIQSLDVNLVGTAAPQKTFVPLNFIVAAGTDYRLVMLSRAGSVSGLIRESGSSWGSYPLTVPGMLSITSGKCCPAATSTSYYYFYEWLITSGCESDRVPVVATIDNTPGCTVPVTLVNFDGEKNGNVNKLWWNTVTEVNNAGFELQRSTDGRAFSKIAFVASKAEGGNSTAALSYSITDAAPLAGTNYYRLKQMDKDGKYNLSNVVVIKGERAEGVMITGAYPNPVRDRINLKVQAPKAQRSSIVLTDVLGRVMLQQQAQLMAGDNLLQVPAQQLAQGTYFIRIFCADGCQSLVHKFIKE